MQPGWLLATGGGRSLGDCDCLLPHILARQGEVSTEAALALTVGGDLPGRGQRRARIFVQLTVKESVVCALMPAAKDGSTDEWVCLPLPQRSPLAAFLELSWSDPKPYSLPNLLKRTVSLLCLLVA